MKRLSILIFSIILLFAFIGTAWGRDGRGGPNSRVWRDKTAAPTVTDDSGSGYRIGDIWVDTTNDNPYILQDTTQGAAVWTQIDGGYLSGITPWEGGTTVYKKSGNLQFVDTNDATVTIADDGGGARVTIDATTHADVVVDADIGGTVQAYDVDTAKVDVNKKWTADQDFSGVSTSANTPTDNSHPTTLGYLNGEVGSSIQAYDVDTAKTDTVQTWTATQTYDTINSNKIIGGVSKYYVQTGTTVTGDMQASGIIYWDSTTMGGVTVPTISGDTPIFVLKDIQGGGVTLFTENNQSILEDGVWGTKIWVAPGNLGHQVALTVVKSSTTPAGFWDVIGSVGANWTLE